MTGDNLRGFFSFPAEILILEKALAGYPLTRTACDPQDTFAGYVPAPAPRHLRPRT